MPLAFNKLNLVYLLINANLKKGRSRFVTDLIKHCDEKINNHQKQLKEARNSGAETSQHLRDKNKISRATLYNYFNSLDGLGYEFSEEESINHAAEILEHHPGLADRFYSRFNDVLFHAFFEFMIDNRFIKENPSKMYAEDVADPLFFSVGKFLNLSETEMSEARSRLSGNFVVFRPSLRERSKIVVSCAQITHDAFGVLHYKENMHYKSGFGWMKQIFNGYIFRKAERYVLVSKDTSTKFIQISYLRVRHTNEKNQIVGMSGSYSGVSSFVSNEFFSTGVVLYRSARLNDFENYDIEKWKHGLAPEFGLVDTDSIDPQIRRYLFFYSPSYD